jgi:hypothetical protein
MNSDDALGLLIASQKDPRLHPRTGALRSIFQEIPNRVLPLDVRWLNTH